MAFSSSEREHGLGRSVPLAVLETGNWKSKLYLFHTAQSQLSNISNCGMVFDFMCKSSGVLVVEAAKESGTETRGSRDIDINQSLNRSPSAVNLVLNTLGPSPLLTCDCDLGLHLAETVHVNTLFNLLVRLTLTVSPQHVQMSCQQSLRESDRAFCFSFFSFLFFFLTQTETHCWLFTKYLKTSDTWQRTGQ